MAQKDPSSPADPQSARRVAARNVKAASRALSILINLIAWGGLGAVLDRWLGTSFLILIGFVLGIMLAMVGLMAMVREADRNRL